MDTPSTRHSQSPLSVHFTAYMRPSVQLLYVSSQAPLESELLLLPHAPPAWKTARWQVPLLVPSQRRASYLDSSASRPQGSFANRSSTRRYSGSHTSGRSGPVHSMTFRPA